MRIAWSGELGRVDLSMPNLLGIAGVVATLIFGVLSIYLFVRRRYPGRLTFIEEQCLSLFEGLVKNLPKMQVLYEGKPVSDNLVLVKGLMLNVGSKDISHEMVEQPLQMEVSNGFKWLAAKVVSSSPGVNGRVLTLNEGILEFDLGLFRCEECIRFEAIAEVPRNGPEGADPAREFRKVMSFRHRIADTAKVEIRPMPISSSPWSPVFQFFFLLVFALATAWILQSQSSERRLYYLAPDATGTLIMVEVSPLNDNLIKLTGVKRNYEATMPMDLFRKLKPIVGPRKRELVFRAYITCILLILASFVLSEIQKYLKVFRLKSIISRFVAGEEQQDQNSKAQLNLSLASQSPGTEKHID